MNQEFQHIKIDIKNQYLNIILDRSEKKNALNPKMINELQEVLEYYEKNNSIKLILISSNSDVFSAGADLEYLQKIKDFSQEENLKDSEILMHLFKTMLLYPKLIISKVCGAAIAGGCGIVTASDIVFATEDSKFGYPEVQIGFVPALVSTFLINKIKETDLRMLLLTGVLIDAQKAKEIGLINHVCNNENIQEEVEVFIEKIISKTSQNSIAETKKMIYLWLDLEKKLEQATIINARNRKSEDFKKGLTCFLNKQPINWSKK